MSLLTESDLHQLEHAVNTAAEIERVDIPAAEQLFDIEGMKLAEVTRLHPGWTEKYSALQAKTERCKRQVQNMLDRVEGQLWRKYNDDHRRTLSAKDISMYIAAEESVVILKQAYVDVCYTHDRIVSIVKALESMNWTISNLTKLHIATIEKMAMVQY